MTHFFEKTSERYREVSLWLSARFLVYRRPILIAVCVAVVVGGIFTPTKHAEAVFWFPFIAAIAVLGGAESLGIGTGMTGFFSWAGLNILNGILWLLQVASASLVYIAIYVFDYVIAFTVGNNFLADPGAVLAIENGWKIVRDTTNLFFIFALLTIAIATILRVSGYGMKALLPRLIIVALLINFSLPITRVVIDASNLVANQFNNSMIAATNATAGTRPSVGTTLLSRMGVKDMFGSIPTAKLDRGNTAIILILQITLNLITAWVFFMGAFVLIARLIAFVFLMVLSPAAFFFAILPKTRKHFDRWLTTLVSQAAVAPLFVFLITVIVIVANSGFIVGAQSKIPGFNEQGEQGFAVNAFFNWAVIVGLLYIAVRVTKDLSGELGAAVTSFGFNKVLGTAGFVGRHTLGLGASALSQSRLVKRLALGENKEGKPMRSGLAKDISQIIARPTAKGLLKVAGGSMDARRLGVTKEAAKISGLTLGGGVAGGYAKIKEDDVKAALKFSKYIGEETETKEEREDRQKAEDKRSELPELLRLEKVATEELKTARETQKAAQEAFNAVRTDIGEMAARQRKEYTELQGANQKVDERTKEYDEAKKKREESNTILKNIEDAIKSRGRARQEADARIVETNMFGSTRFVNPTKRAAAARIRANLKKSPKDKVFDAVTEASKQAADEEKANEEPKEEPKTT
ncbi:hypothetical protein A2761_02595 [Candidatus Kaiserbacteria bacterium RIFCSPHIGHO2_01_FULL_51_33]|uniref:Uncharacterized protein n=1 Tax=Candidatus Kaiserbacteria bacterium RIFCSPLOWO2_01_FULL_51_21 TaxID=1798508 RepID=A0A1F6EDH7_9BACT|nr:MAG: hypothetical protein A2761_02595 [Candidatus Kaiserbacteria bacterium RIFCSPHIGHO2_01_FULL_51_33]OGG71667.1 MAG: hypothetical protein A3A35_00685 [Candidatus Kaiserbacteria bacterium RIFCSPLOWO2_01_FULL_51_21]